MPDATRTTASAPAVNASDTAIASAPIPMRGARRTSSHLLLCCWIMG